MDWSMRTSAFSPPPQPPSFPNTPQAAASSFTAGSVQSSFRDRRESYYVEPGDYNIVGIYSLGLGTEQPMRIDIDYSYTWEENGITTSHQAQYYLHNATSPPTHRALSLAIHLYTSEPLYQAGSFSNYRVHVDDRGVSSIAQLHMVGPRQTFVPCARLDRATAHKAHHVSGVAQSRRLGWLSFNIEKIDYVVQPGYRPRFALYAEKISSLEQAVGYITAEMPSEWRDLCSLAPVATDPAFAGSPFATATYTLDVCIQTEAVTSVFFTHDLSISLRGTGPWRFSRIPVT